MAYIKIEMEKIKSRSQDVVFNCQCDNYNLGESWGDNMELVQERDTTEEKGVRGSHIQRAIG